MMDQFYEADANDIEFIPFDIETTGFKAAEDDFVTTIVIHHKGTYHIWINTDGRVVEASDVQSDIVENSDLTNILLHVCASEKELLENFRNYLVSPDVGDHAILTAFNGETYRGNTDFDVPFLRTRCFLNGVEWILDGFWYADIYEVFSDKSRFDTTIKAEPSLDDMQKPDLKQFVDDRGFDVQYERMLKDDIVTAINNHSGISPDTLKNWSEDHEDVTTSEDPDDLTKSNLKQFIDEMSIDISYEALSKDDIVTAIREQDYDEETLVDWHNETGRSIGTDEATTLDDIHEVIIEDRADGSDWQRTLPFDVENFEPFDPFDDSGEAVTAYKNGDFSGVILHCFADVARTVNLNRVMAEYAPKKDYKPKVL